MFNTDTIQKYYWCPLHYAIQYDNFSTFCLMVEKSYSLEEEMEVRNLCLLNSTVVGGPFTLKSFDSLALNKRWCKPAFAIYYTLLQEIR